MINNMNKVNLGDEVIDTVSGFKGVAVAITEWLTGCARVTVQPKVDKDGKLSASEAFDEPMLKVTKKAVNKKVATAKGGPRPMVMQKSL